MNIRTRARSGFTLIEIMVVVVIVGLLAALVGPEVWRMLGFGQEAVAETQCKYYYDQAKMWQMRTKKAPNSLEDMEAPIKDGEEDFIRIQEDPWGNRYVLIRDGRKYSVISFGPDGEEGTEDDIVFPKPKE